MTSREIKVRILWGLFVAGVALAVDMSLDSGLVGAICAAAVVAIGAASMPLTHQ